MVHITFTMMKLFKHKTASLNSYLLGGVKSIIEFLLLKR
jgi:hypothetical protein